MNRSLALCLISLAFAAAVCAAAPEAENLALGCSYTLIPPPNYPYCTGPNDLTKLTDGVYSKGYFWVQKETAGWSGKALVCINIDLGKVYPLGGVSLNTAAGVAGVEWAQQILIFVSDDGQAWYKLGDLREMVPADLLPAYGTYAVRKLTAPLRAHGRYVQFAIRPSGAYFFTDEIEVTRGPQELLNLALPGPAIRDVPETLRAYTTNDCVAGQLKRDLQAARDGLPAPGLTEDLRRTLTAQADDLAARVAAMPLLDMRGFRAVLPMTDLEREIFSFQAQVWRAQGKPALRAWKSHRWDYLAPSAEPPAGAPEAALAVRMMNRETRADVVNFTNAADAPLNLRLRVEGLPGGATPPYLTVRQVLHCGTRHFVSVAAALPEAPRGDDGFQLPVPSGMTMQAWLQFQPRDLPPGAHEGALVVVGGPQELRVPLSLTISPLPFPARMSLLLGGWDYTDQPTMYGVKPANRDKLVAYLKQMGVNMPWATASALPEGEYDARDNLATPPATGCFDDWIKRWAGARLYMVFLGKNPGDGFAGAAMGSDAFTRRVGNWAHFWAGHLKALGLQPSQLGVLVLDEPGDAGGFRTNEEWARAIKRAEPDLLTFVDPCPSGPGGLDGMFSQMNVLCPNRAAWLDEPWAKPLYKEQQTKGRDLWYYSCSGPARSFDPFSYYLLQAWECIDSGARASCFWAFGDDNGVDVWNDYLAEGPGPYCPMYLDPTSVTTAKWFEAIREGSEDYEVFRMLRDKVKALEAAGHAPPELARAKELLATGAARVLAQSRKSDWRWDTVKDRTVADTVRGEALDVLEKLP